MSDTKFVDNQVERMQLEAEDYVCAISRLYTGHDETQKKFIRELAYVAEKVNNNKLDINDLECLAASCIALRREIVLKNKRFV